MRKIDIATSRAFLATLSTREYGKLSRAEFRRISDFVMSDGCTKVPDIYLTPCIVHDFYYMTHVDLYGQPITKGGADKLFREHIRHESVFKRASIIAFIWFQGVKFFGRNGWN